MTPESPVADSVNSNRVNNRELYAVVHSRTFSRSDQLQAFLRYICDLELAGRGNEISEYSIATEALHRPAAYAPGEDSSVRSRAHALRRKLDEYYETEAPQSELRIELPKGSYRPIFVAKRQQPVPIRTTATPTLKQRRWPPAFLSPQS